MSRYRSEHLPPTPWAQHFAEFGGEFGGEFEGNSREFDGGFGECDAFQYVRGARNPSTEARWGQIQE